MTGRYSDTAKTINIWGTLIKAGRAMLPLSARLFTCTLTYRALGHMQDYINVSGRQYMER